jgi:methylmalonyl-CoA mutase N-terminal domain/subunit
MNKVARIAAMMSRVVLAFLASGGRKARTPFETASMPVTAAQPEANALRMMKMAM